MCRVVARLLETISNVISVTGETGSPVPIDWEAVRITALREAFQSRSLPVLGVIAELAVRSRLCCPALTDCHESCFATLSRSGHVDYTGHGEEEDGAVQIRRLQ